MVQINLHNIKDLPFPVLRKKIRLDSDMACMAYTHSDGQGYYQVFKLPKLGEYVYDFTVTSHSLVTNKWENAGIGTVYRQKSIVDYLLSSSICIGSHTTKLSTIDYTLPNNTNAQNSVIPKIGLKLEFIKDVPLLMGSLENDIYIVFKFKHKPPMKYYIEYELGFLSDPTTIEQLKTFSIKILGKIGNREYIFQYESGKLFLQEK